MPGKLSLPGRLRDRFGEIRGKKPVKTCQAPGFGMACGEPVERSWRDRGEIVERAWRERGRLWGVSSDQAISWNCAILAHLLCHFDSIAGRRKVSGRPEKGSLPAGMQGPHNGVTLARAGAVAHT